MEREAWLRSQVALLEQATKRLDEALSRPKDEFIRDAAIQRFELTFGLAWKVLKGYLEIQGLEAWSPRDEALAEKSIVSCQKCGIISESLHAEGF